MAQFVPLKVETSGEQWQRWASKYPPEGQAIPFVYIIRADGQKLYGKSGNLLGDALPALLASHLAQAGKMLNEQQLAAVQEAVAAARTALEAGDTATAIKRIHGIQRLGPPGNLGSFAKAALEADQLVQELTEQGKSALQQATEKLADDGTKFEGLLALVETKRVYGALPELKAGATVALRDAAKDADLREWLEQAEALDRARGYLTAPGGQSRAASALKLVVTRYPGSPAAELAEEELGKLSVEVPDTPSVAATSPRQAVADASAAAGEMSDEDAKKRVSADLRMAKVFARSRPDKARQYAQNVVDLAPGSEEAREAQKILEELK